MNKRQRNGIQHLEGQVSRRAFMTSLSVAGFGIAGHNILPTAVQHTDTAGPKLENGVISLGFSEQSGSLMEITNQLTKERIEVHGDEFQVEAQEFTLSPQNSQLESIQKTSANTVEATYRVNEQTVTAVYTLDSRNHFFEKHLTVSSSSEFHLKNLVVSRFGLSGVELEWVKYPYLKCVTYFGRSAKGGIFLGVELPYDTSSLDQKGQVCLSYSPSMKVKAHERAACEPIYCGVYQRKSGDTELPRLALRDSLLKEPFYTELLNDTERSHLPLHSESEAMVAAISAILGPHRERLQPNLNGWESQMATAPYGSRAEADEDMRSLDFGAACGIDVFGNAAPWAGDFPRLADLRDGDHLRLSDLTLTVAQHARAIGMKWQIWHSLNNTDPWSPDNPKKNADPRVPPGQAYRPDKPEWRANLLDVSEIFGPGTTEQGNCFANEPFFEWLYARIVDALDAGHFGGWGIDGDFLGGPGYSKPANCSSSEHDHLPGDSNYVCERNLIRLAARIREKYPDMIMSYARPPMDLGVWLLRNVDSVFTLEEYAEPIGLPTVAPQPANVFFGDKIRMWSRIRVQRHFFPNYLDAAQLFGIPLSHEGGAAWQSEGLDYIMLSALASSPNHIYYLPTKNGIPEPDKQKIKKWLDWGREQIQYLMVRKDLSDWPSAGKVDGFAHIKVDRGFVFLFNPNSTLLTGTFHLDDSIGLVQGPRFTVTCIHPSRQVRNALSYGQEVEWQVPAQTAVLLEIVPAVSTS